MEILNYVSIGVIIVALAWLFLTPKNSSTTTSVQSSTPATTTPKATQPTASQSTTLQIPMWLIATFILAAGLAILTQFVNPWFVFIGFTLLVVVMAVVIWIYQKEDIKTIQAGGQTLDGSSASVTLQVSVSRRATGVFEFLQLTLFDLGGDDYDHTVTGVLQQLVNIEIAKIPSDSFLGASGIIAAGVQNSLNAMPDPLFRVTRISVKPSLPPAMVEALVQRATATVDAQNLARTLIEARNELKKGGINVPDEVSSEAYLILLKKAADTDRISAAGTSFGALGEWLLQRIGRIVGGGDGAKKP